MARQQPARMQGLAGTPSSSQQTSDSLGYSLMLQSANNWLQGHGLLPAQILSCCFNVIWGGGR